MLQMRSVFDAVAAGLVFAGAASAQVTDLEFFVDLDVPGTYVWNGMGDPADFVNFDFVRDESLELQGGYELLPLDLTVQGGEILNSDNPFFIDKISTARLAAIGSLSSNGHLALNVSQSADYDAATEIFIGNQFSSMTTTFMISEPSEYRAELLSYGQHPDAAGFGVSLVNESGTVFALNRDSVVLDGDVREGILPAGEYTLFSSAGEIAGVSFSLDIVPAPGTAALALMSSVVLVRRRRA